MTKSQKKVFLIILAGVAAIAIIAVAFWGAVRFFADSSTAVKVLIDINPEIEIELNKNGKIVDADIDNIDDKYIFDDDTLKGETLKNAVNRFVDEMVKNGYLSENENSVLVSVYTKNADNPDELKNKMRDLIDTAVKKNGFDGAILVQHIEHNAKNIKALAEKYDISEGKAKLISVILENDKLHSFGELAKLNVHELNLIASGEVKAVERTGTASDGGFIGRQEAMLKAYIQAGVTSNSAVGTRCELDYENGKMVYEVEFRYAGKEYEYHVDAKTGEILEFERDNDSNTDDKAFEDSNLNDESLIGREAALKSVFENAAIKEKDVRDIDCELEKENGKIVYEIDFEYKGYEYEYDVDALNGDILKSKKQK